MKFLYLGERAEKGAQLSEVFGRNGVDVVQSTTPESAFFLTLRETIDAVFIDAFTLGEETWSVIANLESLDQDIEIVLIGQRPDLSAMPVHILRSCFGYISEMVSGPLDQMVLHQLTEKLSLKEQLNKLKSTSEVDGLTQLYNHGFIQSQLEEEVRILAESGESLSLVMLDIDHFKNYNDTNGHPAGDEVLRRTAKLLESVIRKFDFAGRYGGEEFALVLPCCNLISALQVAERARIAISGCDFAYGAKQPMGFVSASLGVASLDEKTIRDKHALLDIADQALYKAKEDGRNRVWYFRDGLFHHFHPDAKTSLVLN